MKKACGAGQDGARGLHLGPVMAHDLDGEAVAREAGDHDARCIAGGGGQGGLDKAVVVLDGDPALGLGQIEVVFALPVFFSRRLRC